MRGCLCLVALLRLLHMHFTTAPAIDEELSPADRPHHVGRAGAGIRKTNPIYCVYVQISVRACLEFVKTKPKLRKLCRFCGGLVGESLAEPVNRQIPALCRF